MSLDPVLLKVLVCRGKGLDVERLAELVRRTANPGDYDVIVLDALYKLIPPGKDENSNTDMLGIYNTIIGLADYADASIAVIHHATKGRQDQKSVTDMGAGAIREFPGRRSDPCSGRCLRPGSELVGTARARDHELHG